MSQGLRLFGFAFLQYFPPVLAHFVGAWLFTFLLLLFTFRWIKGHVRPHLLRWDDQIRVWALGLRYRERGNRHSERHPWTYFMRFWTNFSSSPALSLWSFVVPIFAYCEWGAPGSPAKLQLFLYPGFCFGGAMLLSFITKKIFKRVRPVREHGAFGHKMKDASFPSGHSLTSFTFYLMLGVATATYGFAWPTVAAVFAVGMTVAGLTGLSRIYLGVHHPSDVFGGYTMGAVWCLVCYFTLLPVLLH